ncbi:MAG: hypothetical protein Tsb0010_01720 [Parvularculaceae bacterium]
MRGVFIILLVVLALGIGALLLAPNFIPVSAYKGRIEAQASQSLGRAVTISDDLELSLFPHFRFTVRDLAVANIENAAEANLIAMDEAALDVALLPLLRGDVQINRFVLIRPQINLERFADGAGNWELGAPSDQSASDATGPQELRLGDVRIEDGAMTFRDHVSGETYRAEEINVALSLPSLSAPFEARGDLRFQGRPVSVDTRIDSLDALRDGREAEISANARLDDARIEFEAAVVAGETPRFNGRLSAEAPSVRDLMEWLAEAPDLPGGLGPLEISGEMSGTANSISFANAQLAFDGIEGGGALNVDWSGARPLLSGTMALSALDLRPYMAPAGAQAAEGTAAADAFPPWSREAIDFTGLRVVDLDFALQAEEMLLPNLTIGESALNVRLANGVMTADLTRLSLYEGQGSGALSVDARRNAASVSANFDLSGLAARPFMADAVGMDRIQGTADLNFAMTTRGASQAEFAANLNGTGAFNVVDGAIVGVNLAQLARAVGSLRQGDVAAAAAAAQASAAQTDFAEFSASFAAQNGMIRTDDILLLNPYLRMTGGGTVNLPAQSVDIILRPRVVASAQGQGGAAGDRGLGAPFRITGTFNDPRVALATEEVVRGVLRNQLERLLTPEEGEEGAQAEDAGEADPPRPEDAAIDILRGILTPDQQDTEEEEGGDVPPPEEAAINLIRGILAPRKKEDNQNTEEPPR